MANHKSAAKRARQTPKRRDRNRAVRSRVRSAVKGFLEAVEGGDADAARTHFRSAERQLRKAASHGVLPKGQVSRKVSRLAKRLHA